MNALVIGLVKQVKMHLRLLLILGIDGLHLE